MHNRRTICTTPPGCHNGCGIIAHLKDGKVVEITGDPSNPFNQGSICPRGAALPSTVYHNDRILHPLIKRKSGWQKASWEEALARAGDAFLNAKEKHGPASVLFCKGTGRDIGPWLSRLAYGFGSSEYYALGPGSGSACLMPRMSVSHSLFGGFMVADCSQYFPLRYDDPRWKLPECILVWGSNPVDSNPDGFLGKWIVSCMKLGSKLIVVDPKLTWMARRADVHLALDPGTDAALAMCFLHILFRDDLVDSNFTDHWVNGVDDVWKQVESYTPERVALECGIPVEKIVSAALLYGSSKPSALHWGVSVDMSPSALGTAHALCSLVVLSGNLDVPGGNIIVTDPFGISRRGVDKELASSLQKYKTGLKEHPMIGSGVPYAQADVLLDEIDNGRRIECAWYQGTGLTANGFAEPARVSKILGKTEFSVMVDLFMSSASDELCDVFLPVCTCLERAGIRNWWYQLAAFDRVIEPLGESRSDMDIVLSFGKIVAPEHFPWTDVTGWFDHVLEPSGYSWSELCKEGWLMPGTEYNKHEINGGFKTSSGKIELQPELMKRSGLLPAPWSVTPPSSRKWKDFPLKLTTGARSPLYFHGEHKNVQQLRELEPYPTVEVHPDDLPSGISSGDWIFLETPWGKCRRVAVSSPLMKLGVISSVHGWEGPELNINNLLTSGMQGRGGLGYPFRCLPCRITAGLGSSGDGIAFPKIVRDIDTIWCTGCRACAVACKMHTGANGLIVRMKNGEWTPGFTSSCISCGNPVCVAACHTGALDEVFSV